MEYYTKLFVVFVAILRASTATAPATATAPVAAHPRPNSQAFWVAYTNVNYDTIPDTQHLKVWDLIGGQVGRDNKKQNANTCATRLSYGLNYGGDPIPVVNYKGFSINPRTTKDDLGKKGDDKNYIVRAKSLGAYLWATWGTPDKQLKTEEELKAFEASLAKDQCAVFVTDQTRVEGHAGVIRQGYSDTYVHGELPIDVWLLPVPPATRPSTTRPSTSEPSTSQPSSNPPTPR